MNPVLIRLNPWSTSPRCTPPSLATRHILPNAAPSHNVIREHRVPANARENNRNTSKKARSSHASDFEKIVYDKCACLGDGLSVDLTRRVIRR